ncbi:hypothetical protein A500_19894 [Clostridium sartagoforme AAU1]|uniref:Uncharacterized protein n=1 Tax=Clostridium sartagoforme AAU1 TaxID=1202534 RepID=R9BY23_9CLOT|nr:hypothetical protein A500_19894 [Clostridium sartagoforme AAU1]
MVLLISYVANVYRFARTRFTFQYGATNIITQIDNNSDIIIFTFQYGATNIKFPARTEKIALVFTFQYGATNI